MRLQKEIHVQQDKNGIGEDAVSIVVADGVVYLPLEDLIDREKEIERLTKSRSDLQRDRTLRGNAEQSEFCEQGTCSQGRGREGET